MTSTIASDRCPTGIPLRALIAVHGRERAGWMTEACRVLSRWATPSVRILAVLDVPAPPFTSLTSSARRRYTAARAAWRAQEEIRLQEMLEELLPLLPRSVDVVRAASGPGDVARSIVHHAAAWPADVVVVGAPMPGLRSWLWPGSVHERVLRRMPCTVLVTAPPARTTAPRPGRLLAGPPAMSREPRPAAVDGGA